MTATVVLVHGAWHGAWCWERVVTRLHERGVRAVAVDLPGHGDHPGPFTDLHGDADHVRAVLDQLAADGEHDDGVVLVGHSYGGAVITEAGTHSAVRHLVYLCAFAVDETDSLARIAPDHPDVRAISHDGRPELAAAFQMGDDGTCTLDPELAAAILYNHCDADAINWAIPKLGKQPLSTFAQPPAAVAWRTVPSTYVVCEDDLGVHPDLQRFLAARCTHTVTWPTGHSPFASHPDLVADLFAELAEPGAGQDA